MKIRIVYIFLCFLPFGLQAQHDHGPDGHTHGPAEPSAEATKPIIKTSENHSEKYELLAKFDHIHPGEEGHIDLYLSDYHTNRPLEAKLTISSPESKGQTFEVNKMDIGMYEIHTTFPKAGTYSLNVSIDGSNGPDLLQLKNIISSDEDADVVHIEENHSVIEHYMPYILMFVLFGVGLWLGMVYQKRKLNHRTMSIILLLSCVAIPLGDSNAHEGHDNFGGGNLGSIFEVPKETQFLLDVLTTQANTNNFEGSVLLYGTVIPSNNGSSVVSTPQTGKISSLHVNVGQKVTKGQKLAVITTYIDVNTQVAIESNKISVMEIEAQRNILEADLAAAQKEYDRLQKIADIAAKKDIDESTSRLAKAKNNLNLFNNTSARGSFGKIDMNIVLYAPISGVVSEFALAQGSTVNIGQELFTISNIEKVYIEGQIYDRDVTKLTKTARYEAQCVNDDHKADIKLISNPQTINVENQSQKVLFELDNKNKDFKLGEFVNVRLYDSSAQRGIALPNSAISEINGKSIVFIKGSAEKYKIQYVNLGENNGTYTQVAKGLVGGEHVVVNGTYQVKMMYLNQ